MSSLLNVALPIKEDLPAGADPYEEFDFVPYFQEVKSEEELRNTWRVFTKVKDVLDNGRRLENARQVCFPFPSIVGLCSDDASCKLVGDYGFVKGTRLKKLVEMHLSYPNWNSTN